MQFQLLSSSIALLAAGLGLLSLPAAAQVTPYGSGINPAGSLLVTYGGPQIGAPLQLTVRNTAVANPLPGVAFLSLSTQPAPGFPGGVALPGLGLASPGTTGELLIDMVAPNPFWNLSPALYQGGSSPGASFNLEVPSKPALIGLDLYAQSVLMTPNLNFSLGLTNGLRMTLGPLTAPIPGVTPIPGFAIIQSGTFQMGSTEAPGIPYFASSDESPVHAVTISKPFWMGATEVTQEQYQSLIGTNPSSFPGASLPVERVSWLDAQTYCASLTAQQTALGKVPLGYQYRLPSEAEWEYACRAGTTTEFSVGYTLFCNQARFALSLHSNTACNSSATAPVGSYPATPWGLYDMSGNVWEWCLDSYSSYTADPVTDPLGSGSGFRILRGGAWNTYSNSCRSARRGSGNPGEMYSHIGFRVVLAPILVP
jgi:formylglycine-generating enzyme required for sulfatase activity